MPSHPSPQRGKEWLALQNLTRAVERRAAGKHIRGPKTAECSGRKRARDAWVRRRSAQRLLTRMRQMRRSTVRGRRRLWGKGPVPEGFYGTSAPSLGAFSPAEHCDHRSSEDDLCGLSCGSLPSPVSAMSVVACCSSSVRTSPSCASACEEPLDDEMFRLIEATSAPAAGIFNQATSSHEQGLFRFLARRVGVRC